MKPYFFIPANKIYKLQDVEEKGIRNIIIDFEDSIIIDQKKQFLEEIFKLDNLNKYWFRTPIRNNFKENLDINFIMNLLDHGVKNIILPKVLNKTEFDKLMDKTKHKDFKLILLVEHPRLFLELESIMNCNRYLQIIYGLALGSHDFVNELNASYSLESLYYARQKIKYIATAFNKIAIDIVSMNIADKDIFKNETTNGLNLGFDAKFIIHPIQYDWLIETVQTSKQFLWAKKIINNLPEGKLSSDHSPFILEGQIVEKPHIERAFKFFQRYKNYEK